MVAQLKELKTNRSAEKERMLSYLDYLREEITNDRIENLICIIDDSEVVNAEVMGDMNIIQAVGLFDTAKLCYQMSSFEEA